jgi:protein-S-isoprenylcysteine O-methyltransferase Ste14
MSSSPNKNYLRYVILGRFLPFFLFSLFAVIHLALFLSEIKIYSQQGFSTREQLDLVNRLVAMAFPAMVAGIYVFRKPANSGTYTPFSFLISIYASFVLLALKPLGSFFQISEEQGVTEVRQLLAILTFILGGMLVAYSIFYLRQNFSIVPEARELVSTGPYGFVRHPVYLGEILASFGFLLSVFTVFYILIVLSFISAQVIRMNMEEALLAKSIPEYELYKQKVKYRIFPGIY